MLRCKLVWRSFCYYKICVNSFQIIRSIIFSAVKKVSLPHSRTFFLLNDFFHSRGMFFYNQEIFLQSTNLSTVKKFFHSRGNFQQSRNSSTVTEFFQNQGIFWHLWKFWTSRNFPAIKKFFNSQGIFPQLWTFPTIKKLFHNQKGFPQWINFSPRYFYKQEGFLSFPWSKTFSTKKEFYTVKKICCKQRLKNFSNR